MKKPVQLLVLVALMGLETLAVFGSLVALLVTVLTGQERSLALIASLGGVIAVFGIWMIFVTRGLWQLKPWSRSAAVFWQTVQLAIAWGSFTGQFAQPAIGVALIVPSLAVFYLVFSRPLSALLQRHLES